MKPVGISDQVKGYGDWILIENRTSYINLKQVKQTWSAYIVRLGQTFFSLYGQ